MKKYKRSIRIIFSEAGFSPRTDWAIALGVCATLLILIAITSGLIFVRLSTKSPASPASAASEAATLDRDKINEAAKYFRNRPVTAGPDASVLVDPSR